MHARHVVLSHLNNTFMTLPSMVTCLGIAAYSVCWLGKLHYKTTSVLDMWEQQQR